MGTQKVVGGVEDALSMLKSSDGKVFNYEYGADRELNQTMTVKGTVDRLMVWNPETKFIQKDGEWRYQIVPSDYEWVNSKIERVNGAGQRELWWKDQRKGIEVWTQANGESFEKKWFVSGPFTGKTRSIIKKKGFQELYNEENTYDNESDLMISKIGNQVFQYKKNELVAYSLKDKFDWKQKE